MFIPEKKVLFIGCKPHPYLKIDLTCEFDTEGVILPKIKLYFPDDIPDDFPDKVDADAGVVLPLDSINSRSLSGINLNFAAIESLIDDPNIDDLGTALTLMALIEAIKILRITVWKCRRSAKEKKRWPEGSLDTYVVEAGLIINGSKGALTLDVDEHDSIAENNIQYFVSDIRLMPLDTQ